MNNAQNQGLGRSLPEFRQCFGCYYEGVGSDKLCPRCRKPKFFTSGNIRTRGIILIAVGVFLAGLMVAVSIGVGFVLTAATKNPDSATKINDDVAIVIAMYALFAILIAFSVQSIVSGGWMAISGKRNRIIVWVMWLMLAMVLIAGGIVRFLLP